MTGSTFLVPGGPESDSVPGYLVRRAPSAGNVRRVRCVGRTTGGMSEMKGKWIVLAALLIAALPAFAAQPAPGRPAAHATFAGGCFWCMVHPFDQLPGVISVTSGYTGGGKKNPTYEEVSSGATGHAESVDVVYDPAKVSYEKLLDVFWHN